VREVQINLLFRTKKLKKSKKSSTLEWQLATLSVFINILCVYPHCVCSLLCMSCTVCALSVLVVKATNFFHPATLHRTRCHAPCVLSVCG
jgi:hypothetical protein